MSLSKLISQIIRNQIKCIYIITLLLLTYQIIYAQSNFQEGYLLITKFDTLYGQIDNKNYYQNSQICYFKLADSISSYYPNQIYGYRFTRGKYYISKQVNLDGQLHKLFLEYLINGRLDIYYYRDALNFNHYFVSKDSLPIRELIYYEGIKEINGKQIYYQVNKITGILEYYTSGCSEIKKLISEINEPTHKNLIQFAKKYHEMTCQNDSCIIYEKKMPKNIKLTVFGGTTIFYYSSSEVNRPIYSMYGFNLLLQQPIFNENIYLGLGFIKDGKIIEPGSGFRIPISVYYIHSRTKFSPFVGYDVNIIGLDQTLKLGIRDQIKNVSLYLGIDLKIVSIIFPYGSSFNVGMMFDLRK